MNEEAQKQLASIQYVDRIINELRAEVAALQTARNAYGRALVNHLDGQE